ncbi:MAG: manganese/zinc/iron transport system substrate-binding protein [Flavobacteriales bacterium]|jgi:manganese/zinc/iron transport system substrate-binding protein
MRIIFALLVSTLAFSCRVDTTKIKTEGILKVVCTTGMIGDAVLNIGGSFVEVTSLMGPGVDPHLYKASQGDLTSITGADIIFYNGLHLEGKMGEILEKVSRYKPVVAMSSTLDSSKLIDLGNDLKDPHIWFDVALWSTGLEGVKNALIALDPEHTKGYENNYLAYLKQLSDLDHWALEQLASIPEHKRILITSHDAFSYFGQAYNIKVEGLQGISTLAEYGLRDITNMVHYVISKKIHSVFVESSVSKKSLEAVIQGCEGAGHQLKIGGELFSDAMGQAGTLDGTYIGMIKHNVKTITEALN